MKNKKINFIAFTLVELIVVITILAILGTIAFISLQGYAETSRDSVRISDMRNIELGFELELIKRGKVTKPEEEIEITASGTLIAYQGYATENVLNKIGVHGGGKDPIEEKYYTYMTNSNLTKYQILGYLEGEEGLSLFKKSYATDLSKRYPNVLGSQLGVLLQSGSLNPIQDSLIDVDIVNTNEELVAYLDSENMISGTGIIFTQLLSLGNNFTDCNEILKKYGYGIYSGLYKINPNGKVAFDVYCDMVTDGGGWIRYVNIKGNYSFYDAKNCWLGKKIKNNLFECFNPNRFNLSAKKMMGKVLGKYYFYNLPIEGYNISYIYNNGTLECLGGYDYMTLMSNKKVNSDGSNAIRIRLGLSYCSHTRSIGGSTNSSYMNYSYGFGPTPGGRESNTINTELYIK